MDTYNNDYSFADSYLADGDFVLWRGKPEKGMTLGGGNILSILFGVFWIAFVVFWVFGAISSGAPLPMIIFGLMFLGVGIGLIAGRPIMTEMMKPKTAYVITNKAIIKKCGRMVEVLYSRDAHTMQVYSHKNGTTSFIFDTNIVTHRVNHTAQTKKFTIDNVHDAAGVNRALAEMDRA